MFLVQQYYLLDGEVKSRTYSICETLKEAYNDQVEVYKALPEMFIIFPSIPSEIKDEFLKFILNKNKDKNILTII
ncbi:hypothetical protein FDE98_14295 [Clostridium sporogenes]|uniref:Uncharacterized protein n=2 Tax=Clostridium TaxID=1485 RepID=A0A077K2U0_CLOBO|nr:MULTISPECIES: hypothetical protein [Clostridium]AJD29075.1 putative membrane protein [Clostridium botulinum Prevot_594]MBE1304196.1 hypothetical protein [Clostridium botulinum]NFL98054.1 hypothetical protein [Clostridium botulinum]NFP55285.1 hypothetical protein [Clostridium botulinum]NFQ17307.1 hypothetical protein [Clostridium sporogenes]